MRFNARFQGSEFGVRDRQQFLRLLRMVRQQYLLSILQNKLSFFEEGREDGLGFFKFPFGESSVSLFFWEETRRETILAIYSQFLAEQYEMLNVDKRDVLDVGANCGDTTLYFALKGAKRVISLEPFPAVFDLARRAVKASAVENIVLLNEGAGKPQTIRLDPSLPTDPSASIEAVKDGVDIRISSLQELVDRFNLNDAALKIDCEGCEYDLVNEASDETLSHFSQIILEYERPPRLYADRLKKAGFKVQVFKSSTEYVRNSPVPGLEVSLVYGKL
jgi:FkbM family methyltransferase